MATYRVANQAQLNSALSKLQGGDTLLLASGNYAKLQVTANFDRGVTITSVDKSRPAVIAELEVRGASNVKMDGLKFDHTGRIGNPFEIENSSKIAIVNSTFDGHVGGDGFAVGRALTVNNSSNILVENNDVARFQNALTFQKVQNLIVRENDISGTSNDGARFIAVTNVEIEGNTFRDARSPASLAHKDSIQFWDNGEGVSRNVVIRDNEFSNKEKAHTIFMGSAAARADASKAFENFLIEGNTLKTGHFHGISIEHINGVVIRDNVLERFPGLANQELLTPVINVGSKSKNVTIEGNKVASLQKEAGPSWDISGNTLTSSKEFAHWLGGVKGTLQGTASEIYKAWLDASRPDFDIVREADMVRTGATGLSAPAADLADGDVFNFKGWAVTKAGRATEIDFDVEDGDVILFAGYEGGTFQGKAGGNALQVSADGKWAKLDSVADIAELAARSGDVDAWTRDDDLFLRIRQDRGAETITLDGLAGEFRAANDADFF